MTKKCIVTLIGFCFIGLFGCSKEVTNNVDYGICNQTSNGKMAEVEDGYFFVFEQFLYYADKTDLETWVAVCNKPECFHQTNTCNAYIPTATTLWQKDNKLYGTTINRKEKYLSVYEMSVDGSGAKNVYEIPTEVFPSGHGMATFQDQFIIRYNYLDEQGFLQERIISLEDDKDGKASIDTLYANVVDNASLVMSGNEYWNIRGENLLATTLYLKDGGIALENLCKIENDQIEPLNLTDDVELYGSYFKDDVFTYYKQKEGFYGYNVSTGENKLLFENQLEDGQGFILSEDCIIECNRYLYYTPEKAYLRFYNGEEWFEVELPEQLAKSDDPFYPVSLASDRIFFRRNVMQGENSKITAVQIYYMMLNDENPQLTLAGMIGEDIIEEETSTEILEDDVFANFEEVTVFDTEEYFLKVTDVYLDYKNRCCVDFYFENRSEEINYHMFTDNCAINGIYCKTSWGQEYIAGETKTATLCFRDDIVNVSKVSEFYKSSEYTNIEIDFLIRGKSKGSNDVRKLVRLYPQGEENAISFTREPKESDIELVNNEDVSVIITGYDENFVSNDIINVIIQNKTEESFVVKVEEASANGIAVIPNIYFGTYWTIVNPGAVVLYPMTLFDDEKQYAPEGPARMEPSSAFFDRSHITSIEEIEMKLRIMEYNPITGPDEENNIVYETFVLNP